MKNIIQINNTLRSEIIILVIVIFFFGCGEDPKKEDTPELVTKATLTFTPEVGTALSVSASDPDGLGVLDIEADGEINLSPSTTYILTLSLINELAEPSMPEYDVSAEIEEEGAEHIFFFSCSNDTFSDPAGDGNIDNRADDINYTGGANSVDINGLPLGLTTTWTTSSSTITGGTFRVLLKHQPELKSNTSDSNMGETDLDIEFTINVQ